MHEYALSFPDGYQYDVRKNVLAKYHFPNNHFTSYVTDKKDKTVYDFGHINLTEQNETAYLNENEPMWVEVIHGMNVYNRMGTLNPFDYVRRSNLEDGFGVNIAVSRNRMQLVYYYFYFAILKGWNKRNRIGVFLRRKLGMKYKDDRTDR